MEPPAQPDPTEAADKIREWAHELGFQGVGFAKADHADPEGRLQSWLDRGFAGSMDYMAKTVSEREDPRRIVSGAQSVVALAMSYRRDTEPAPPLKVSRYAMSDDYHTVMRKRVRRLRSRLMQAWPGHIVKPTVDTSPVLERAWAERAGVAWIGKSTMAISPKLGTYTFLATLVTTLKLEVSRPLPDRCGSCTRCLDACPTDAFVAPRELDATRCIAYWTVEEWGPVVPEMVEPHGWVAGCDICQEVCPWNKFGVNTEEPRLQVRDNIARPDVELFSDESRQDELTAVLQGTPLQRTGAEVLRRNTLRVLSAKTRQSQG